MRDAGSVLQICELDPGYYRECEALVVDLQGRFEVLAISVYSEGDTNVGQYGDHEYEPPRVVAKETITESVATLSNQLEQQTVSATGEGKQNKCSTCNAVLAVDPKKYREHFKTEWHRHNMKRKTRNLAPLSEEDCLDDVEMADSKSDLKDYSF